MQVGVNYPWLDYGWDFGLGPPEWRGNRATPRWYGEVDKHLEHLHDLGISVVRWFILADGLTYGTGIDAPTLSGGRWRFDPPMLGTDTREHFSELLQRISAFNAGRPNPLRLLPVLIDFHFCGPGTMPVLQPDPLDPLRTVANPGWVKQGRADAVIDPAKRRRFLDRVLDPLLEVSQTHRDVILAWELINEPDWITNTWNPDGRNDHPIDQQSMRAFLEDGKGYVRRAGFKPTIGFALFDTLRSSSITAEINQFHHYADGTRRLPQHTFDPRFPGIIGEFATALGDIWPDLAAGRQGVLHRLRLSAERGYPLALAWSFLAHDRHTSWSSGVEREIKLFTDEQAGATPVASEEA